MKVFSGLAALATIVGSGIAGWKVTKARGADRSKAPSFDARWKYVWRGAWLGGFSNFLFTITIWIGVTACLMSYSDTTGTQALAMTAVAAFISIPFGAAAGSIMGLIWYATDAIRRTNATHPAVTTPAAIEGIATAPASSPSFAGVKLPKDLGFPRGTTTGDPLWDDFHKTTPTREG